jgi:uncharacterized protein (TIGR02246 family)
MCRIMARMPAIAIGFCAAVLLTPLPVRAQRGASTEDRALAARIQRIEDTQEIGRLLLNYGRHLDARDFKAYALLFARDGVWSGGMGTVQGPAAIQAFMEKAIPGPNAVHNYHVLSNFVIDVNGDTATAWSRWMFMVPGPNNTAVAAQSGRYDDTLVREDGRWKFKRRAASNDIPAAGPPPAQLKK